MGELQSLDDIFNNKIIFRIPDYQRGYAWKNEQLRDFWEDVINIQENREHYTGLLSIQLRKIRPNIEQPKDWDWLLVQNYKVYDVIDGQQRLTTFVILINELVNFVCALPKNKDKDESEIDVGDGNPVSAIREKYLSKTHPRNPEKITYLLGYHTDKPSEDYLQYRILNRKYSGEVQETYYTRNLNDAKNFFAKELKCLYSKKGDKGIEDLFWKLTLKLKFNLHEITDDYNVYVAFETMNNRGKKLTNLELLKNRLIYLTTLFPDTEAYSQKTLRDTINETWREIYHQLGRNSKVLLSDDEFLRAHWIMFFKYSRNKGAAYVRYLLDRFSQKSIDAARYIHASAALEDDNTFSDDVIEDESENSDELDNNDSVDAILENSLTPKDIVDYVNSLKEIAQFWYYTFFPEDEREFLSSEEKLWLGKLNHIGIAYFRPLIAVSLLPRPNFTKEDRLKLFKSVERFIFINFRIGWSSSSYGSSYYYDRTRRVYKEDLALSEVVNDLNCTTNRNIKDDIDVFVKKMKRLFSDNDGFYTWRNLKYFLFKYECSLSKDLGRGEKIEWERFANVPKGEISVEHIFPQTPTEDWEEMYEQYSYKQKTMLMSTLGNLLPLRTSINSSLQNDSFDKKKQKYINGGYSEVEVSQNYTWGAQEIYERGMKMLCFMAKRWNLKFESQQQMEELLHVDFIQEKKILPENLHKYLRVDADARLVSLCQKFIKMKSQKGEVNEGVFFKDQYVRFTTDAMSKIIPKEVEAESEWGTHDFYFYEFVCEDSSVRVQLAIYAAKTISEELRKTYINIHKKYKRFENLGDKDSFRKNFKAFYELPFETDPVEVDDCISEEDLFKVFEKLYSQLIVFEKDFITKIS